MMIHRDTPAVVHDGQAVIGVDDHRYRVAVAGLRLIHAVVHRLVKELVQAAKAGIPDVHGGPFPDRFKTLENLDVLSGVGLPGGLALFGDILHRHLMKGPG